AAARPPRAQIPPGQELPDDYTLGDAGGDAGVSLGWKRDHLVVLRLQTDLPMQDYYPGGDHWSIGAAPDSATRGANMTSFALASLAALVAFCLLLSFLTETRVASFALAAVFAFCLLLTFLTSFPPDEMDDVY
ncbi:hypothetical protein T484DRAFT_1806184, partial [Baffinella frigidus]